MTACPLLFVTFVAHDGFLDQDFAIEVPIGSLRWVVAEVLSSALGAHGCDNPFALIKSES